MSSVSSALLAVVVLVLQNVSLIVFLVGLALLYVGAWHWSIGAANLILGAVLVFASSYQYVVYVWRKLK